MPVTREYPIREYSPHADQGWNNDDLPPSPALRGNEYLLKPEQQLGECITYVLKIHRATFLYLSIFPGTGLHRAVTSRKFKCH